MSLLRSIAGGFRSLFRKEQVSQELDEELNGFLEMAAEEKMKHGMSRKDALRAVRLERGNLEITKEVLRAAGWEFFVETCWQDLRFAARMLRKNPGFAAVAVLTLALGIGANTASFSVVNAILLRPLPFQDSGRLMMIWHTPPQKSFPGVARFAVSPANYLDWRSQNHVFDQLSAIGFRSLNLTGMGQPESVTGIAVAADFFSVLRIRPSAGRGFVADDDQPGRGNVVVVSYAFRQSHFGANENILGRTIKLDDQSYEIIGVMPRKSA